MHLERGEVNCLCRFKLKHVLRAIRPDRSTLIFTFLIRRRESIRRWRSFGRLFQKGGVEAKDSLSPVFFFTAGAGRISVFWVLITVYGSEKIRKKGRVPLQFKGWSDIGSHRSLASTCLQCAGVCLCVGSNLSLIHLSHLDPCSSN